MVLRRVPAHVQRRPGQIQRVRRLSARQCGPCFWYCNTRRHNWTPIFFRNLFVVYCARYGEFRWPGPEPGYTQRGDHTWVKLNHTLRTLERELEGPGDRLPWPELPWPRPPRAAYSERRAYDTIVVKTWQAWLRACRHCLARGAPLVPCDAASAARPPRARDEGRELAALAPADGY